MSQDQREQSSVRGAGAQRIAVESRSFEREAEGGAPVLEPALLEHVHQLNLDYLELLIAERDTTQVAAQLQHLPPRQRAALTALSPRALRARAALPNTRY